VTARIDLQSRYRSIPGGSGYSVMAGVLSDPAGKKHELFEVGFPYHCAVGVTFGDVPQNPDPYSKTIACLGDDGWGGVTATSDFGVLHVDAHPYGRGPLQQPFDIALGPCERARIVVPSKLPSGH
jgi:hypothetical protein